MLHDIFVSLTVFDKPAGESEYVAGNRDKFGKEDSNINKVCNSALCKYSKIAVMQPI